MPVYAIKPVVAFNGKVEIDRSTLDGSFLLLCLFVLQVTCVYFTMWNFGLLDHFKPSLYAGMLYAGLAIALFVKGLSYGLLYLGLEDGERGLSRVGRDFRTGWLNTNYMLAFLFPMLILPTFMALFSSMKSVIHLIEPFYLDEFLMRADRFLHFGVDPWRITHAIFSNAALSAMLNYVYNLWFFIMFSYVLWMMVNVHFGRDRLKFLSAFIIVWPLMGSFLAIFLSSAGPVYYGQIVGDPTIFGPMMENLKYFDFQLRDSFFGIYALGTQDMLWADYVGNNTSLGSGISAMPSMHVSVAALLYFSGREVSKYIGYGMLVFLILIQIGSVHLGWHYALDGYVSILLTWGVWKGCGWLTGLVYREQIEAERE